jgi:hypothetical protein
MKHLTWTAALFIVLAGVAHADYAVESLEGSYALSLWNQFEQTQNWSLVGVVTFDGSGGVTGRRIFYVLNASGNSNFHRKVVQTFTGTYDVSADGSGSFEILVSPTTPHSSEGLFSYEPTETYDFVIFNGDRELVINGVMAENSLVYCRSCGSYDNVSMMGFAKSQEAATPPCGAIMMSAPGLSGGR